jgi:hypothetical protein
VSRVVVPRRKQGLGKGPAVDGYKAQGVMIALGERGHSALSECVRHQFGQLFRQIASPISHQEQVAVTQIGRPESAGVDW